MLVQTFSFEVIWIFALCSELICSYYRHIANNLDRLTRDVNKKFVVQQRAKLLAAMKCLKNIEQANHILYTGFSFALLTASCLSFVIMLASCYQAFENKSLGIAIWYAFDATDYFLRFALICFTADRAQSIGISNIFNISINFNNYTEFSFYCNSLHLFHYKQWNLFQFYVV